jgi:hypothetical protein
MLSVVMGQDFWVAEDCGKGGVLERAGKSAQWRQFQFAAGLHRVRKENWTQRQPYKRGAAAVVNLKIQILCPALFIVDARSQKNARCLYPIACALQAPPF